MKIVLFFVLIFLIGGCSNSIKIPESKIARSYSLFGEQSDIKLSHVIGLHNYHDSLLFYDIKTNRIIICDILGNHVFSLGRTGKGPNDILQIGAMSSLMDTIYFFDNGNKRLGTLYPNKNIIKTKSYPKDFYSDFSRFVVCEDGNIFLSNLYSTKPILKLNNELETIIEFGDRISSTKRYNPSSNSFFHILKKDKNIIAVDVQAPKVNIYEKNGKLVDQYDFSNFELFEGRIEDIIKKRKTLDNPESRHAVFFQDAVITQSNFYFLVIQSQNGEMYANSILTGKLENGIMKDFNIIKMVIENDNMPHYYSSICIIKNQLFAFDLMTSQIHVFNLSEERNINLPNFGKLYDENKQVNIPN